jgi:AcrR family transcriptional regulator
MVIETPPPAPTRDSRSARTRNSIEAAALQAFSESGFEAASTRDIAARAGVKQQLITYHYGSKLELWKATADGLFSACRERIVKRAEGLEGVDSATQIRLLVREFLLFSAEHPELARFMIHEGASPGPRLTWLYENHTKRLFEAARDGFATAQSRGLTPAGDPELLTYLFVGAAGMFSQTAEFPLVTGRDPRAPAVVESYIDLVLGLLFPGAPSRD